MGVTSQYFCHVLSVSVRKQNRVFSPQDAVALT